jgi:hypothetical protein
MNEPLNPWEAARSLVESISLSDAIYTIVAVIGVFVFYAIAARRPSADRPSWLAVMFWLIALVGWGFEMYMVTMAKIAAGGVIAWIFLIVAAATLTFAIPALTRKSRLYERILSGSSIALIGFGILASFGRGYQPIGYALVMGLVLGLILGMLISVRRNLDRNLSDEYAEAEKPRQGERKVSEI